MHFAACRVLHFAARVSATGTSAAFRECFLLSAKKILFVFFPAAFHRSHWSNGSYFSLPTHHNTLFSLMYSM
jgi:hypothetical protein